MKGQEVLLVVDIRDVSAVLGFNIKESGATKNDDKELLPPRPPLPEANFAITEGRGSL